MVMIHSQSGNSAMISGSANLTRRNLSDFNLETDVVVEGLCSTPVFSDASRYFEDAWRNRRKREYFVDYEVYEDSSGGTANFTVSWNGAEFRHSKTGD
jgi:hypothetical protein